MVVLCGLQAVWGLELLDLQADRIRVAATAECDGGTAYVVCSPSEDNCVRTCGSGGGGEIAHGPELAVDGERSSSWQSPPLSFYEAAGETIGNHNLTLDLGRVGLPATHLADVLYSSTTTAGSACGGGGGVLR